jgi:hypothetical protein
MALAMPRFTEHDLDGSAERSGWNRVDGRPGASFSMIENRIPLPGMLISHIR